MSLEEFLWNKHLMSRLQNDLNAFVMFAPQVDQWSKILIFKIFRVKNYANDVNFNPEDHINE